MDAPGNPPGCGDIPHDEFRTSAEMGYTIGGTMAAWGRQKYRFAIGTAPEELILFGPSTRFAGQHNEAPFTPVVDFFQVDVVNYAIRLRSGPPDVPPQQMNNDIYLAVVSQYWAQIPKPTSVTGRAWDVGFSTPGPRVQLFWSNAHAGGGQYKTEAYEDGVRAGSALSSATSLLTSTGPPEVTRTFTLRHVSDITPTGWSLAQPNSDFTNSINVVVPNDLDALINGPDGVWEAGWKTWTVTASGGTPPGYHYQWFYQRLPSRFDPVPVGPDDSTYTRWVSTPQSGFDMFRLITTVLDTTGQYYWGDSLDQMLVLVEPEGGLGGGGMGLSADGAAPLTQDSVRVARTGLLHPRRGCVSIPLERAARQRLFRELWDARQVVGCELREPHDR